jgi:WbqC-like protein family
MAGKRIAIVQSNYIPWKGYFDLIHAVDELVLFDDVPTIGGSRRCGFLEITTTITWSMDYALADDRTDRLVGICTQAGAATYVSGPRAARPRAR